MVTRMTMMKITLKRRKDSCGRSVMDWCVWDAERHDGVCDWQGAKWMDDGPIAQFSVWW